ncbi:hypothetical protein [Bacillus salacetis]|nr:hypothetical protein [Bacillus salacetis]
MNKRINKISSAAGLGFGSALFVMAEYFRTGKKRKESQYHLLKKGMY